MSTTVTEPARGATPAAPLEELRARAESDLAGAQREAWALLAETGRWIQADRAAATARLDELFRAGKPSLGIDGPTEGTLVGFVIHPAFDRVTAALARAWLPWAGKRFDSQGARGDNLLLRGARWPAKLLWPLYRTRDIGERLAAFDFETRVEAGAVDPDREVLVIDYAPVGSNPRLIIKRIRDELVELVPGVHLGKVLWRSGSIEEPRYTLLAYFALRTPSEPLVPSRSSTDPNRV
jgi:hypothetical protein